MMYPATIKPLLSSLAFAAVAFVLASSWHGSRSQTNQIKATRNTTEPPVPARGKLGQDLFLAIDHRDTSAVKALIEKGADPNSLNGLEFRPLYIAVASHQPDVVDALLKAGAKPDAQSLYGTPLTFAALTGNDAAVDKLLNLGANPNFLRADGNSVLMMGAYTGNPLVISKLLEHKANIDSRNYAKATALSYACREGNAAAAKLLLDAGADVDPSDCLSQTPLMLAAQTGRADLVPMLLAHGASVNARDASGETPLILAAKYGDFPDVVRSLLNAGADKDVKDAEGKTAAYYAAARENRRTSALLGTPAEAPATPPTPRQSIGKSLEALESSMKAFNQNASCISCHQEGLGRMATGAAHDHGYMLDATLTKVQNERVGGALQAMEPLHKQALKNSEVMKQVPLIEINEVNTTDTWLLAGMAAQKTPESSAAAAMAEVLARQQSPAGYWSFSLPRAPMQSSYFTYTALSVRSLKAYGPKDSAKETAERIRKARAWLATAAPKSSDDMAFKLLGLHWAGGTVADQAKAAALILKAQNPDGGWSQLPGMPSDAYATGECLTALRESARLPATSKQYKEGMNYLLRNQDADGSWFVNKRAFPANNYFDAGFPHGEAQFASFNGTCWAMMALLDGLPNK